MFGECYSNFNPKSNLNRTKSIPAAATTTTTASATNTTTTTLSLYPFLLSLAPSHSLNSMVFIGMETYVK